MSSFPELVIKVRQSTSAFKRDPKGSLEKVNLTILALDPGNTTGWAVFKDSKLQDSGHLETVDATITAAEIDKLLTTHTPAIVIIEEYRVYAWKVKQHAWSDLPTARLIGGIDIICAIKGIPVCMQSAQQAKGFCTDDKLKAWDYYAVGRHARDAVRHGCFWLIFNKDGEAA